MPGNGGIAPVQSRRSVPVLTPLHCHLDDDVVCAGLVERELAQGEVARGVQNDGEGVHVSFPPGRDVAAACPTVRLA